MTPVAEYIDVCGIAPIFIVRLDGGYGFACGVVQLKRQQLNDHRIAGIHWAENAKLAAKITQSLRRCGLLFDKAAAELALQRTASGYGAVLTPNLIVMSRATRAAKRLQDMIDVLDQSGALADFKKQYRLRRLAATARGDGFMSYKVAMLRFRRALIGLLIAKRPIAEVRPVFEEVLRVP